MIKIPALIGKLSPRYIGYLIFIILLIVYPFVFKEQYSLYIVINFLLYSFLGQAWNIIGGYAGQCALGHAAFFGLGAYTSSILFLKFGINPWLGMLMGGLIASGVSVIIGWPSFRLRGAYFALATIAFAEMVRVLFNHWAFVGGAVGLHLPVYGDSLSAFQFRSYFPYYWIIFIFFVLECFLVYKLSKSKIGFYWRAIKCEPDAAESIGIDTTKNKLIAMFISAFLVAIGGTFYSQLMLYIDPRSVLVRDLSIRIALVAIVGGRGTIEGPILGSLAMILLSSFIRASFGDIPGLHLVIFAIILVVMSVYKPLGMMAILGDLKSWIERRKSVAAA
ncbi:MAG: branched-chain amino acid ABC transporter permease [Dehalococcoidia bacterium]|nr:branched-chain amino acid ABC transporter permease [Dehalococcoidia bacterium]